MRSQDSKVDFVLPGGGILTPSEWKMKEVVNEGDVEGYFKCGPATLAEVAITPTDYNSFTQSVYNKDLRHSYPGRYSSQKSVVDFSLTFKVRLGDMQKLIDACNAHDYDYDKGTVAESTSSEKVTFGSLFKTVYKGSMMLEKINSTEERDAWLAKTFSEDADVFVSISADDKDYGEGRQWPNFDASGSVMVN